MPRFVIDDNYTGPVPQRIVTLFRLNNNIGRQFLEDEVCRRVEGARDDLEKVKVYFDQNRHLGLAKIAFSTVAIAQKCAKELNNVSIMGSNIGAVIDPRADKLKQFQGGCFFISIQFYFINIGVAVIFAGPDPAILSWRV